jgi:hypothetical protein
MAVGQYAQTFVGQASFSALRAFLPQGAMSDNFKDLQTLITSGAIYPRLPSLEVMLEAFSREIPKSQIFNFTP